MKTAELQKLDGGLVLVVPGETGGEDPPVGMWGTIRVASDHRVQIILQFAAMFYGHVRQEVLHLDDAAVERLLDSEHDGTYTYRLPGPIEGPDTPR